MAMIHELSASLNYSRRRKSSSEDFEPYDSEDYDLSGFGSPPKGVVPRRLRPYLFPKGIRCTRRKRIILWTCKPIGKRGGRNVLQDKTGRRFSCKIGHRSVCAAISKRR